MKISLLLKREPFGTIFEETMSAFFSDYFSQDYKIKWCQTDSKIEITALKDETQIWKCNPQLNAIFVPGAEKIIFEPIIREFSYTSIWWRKPFQYIYVKTATHRLWGEYLAKIIIKISPKVPDAKDLLIVGGNHKLRLLDYKRKKSFVILKKGFDSNFYERELDTRRLAHNLKLPVPSILEEVSSDIRWYAEEYVIGTPINRLKKNKKTSFVLKECIKSLQILAEYSKEEVELESYVEKLSQSVKSNINQNHLLGKEEKTNLLNNLDNHCSLIKKLSRNYLSKINTVLTHGDFQPANIITNKDFYWIIDWEYSFRRQAKYDGLVYLLKTRFPGGLTKRLKSFLINNRTREDSLLDKWPDIAKMNLRYERVTLAIFLLEEFSLYIEENTNSMFKQLGLGFIDFMKEFPMAVEVIKQS